VHQIVYKVKLLLRSLIIRTQLKRFLELVLGTFVLAGRSQKVAPDDPALRVVGLLLHTLSYLFNRLHHIPLFELGEGPVHVSVVPVAVELFGLSAVVECLVVDHVDVEEEGKVVVCVWVLVVYQDALLQVLHCVLVVADLEVGQPQVIMQLSVVVVDALGLLEGRDREHVLALLVHRDPVVKERLPAARVALLEVFFCLYGQTLPVLGIE